MVKNNDIAPKRGGKVCVFLSPRDFPLALSGCDIGKTDIPDFLGAGHRYWVFKSRTGDDSSLIWTFIHCSVSFRSA